MVTASLLILHLAQFLFTYLLPELSIATPHWPVKIDHVPGTGIPHGDTRHHSDLVIHKIRPSIALLLMRQHCGDIPCGKWLELKST